MYFASVFLHIVFAAFWIGGMLFLPLILLPNIKNRPDRVALLYKTGLSFRFFGWIALLGLASTGLLNLWARGVPLTVEFFSKSDYGRLVVWKIGLFALVLLVSGAHDLMFGKKALEDFERGDDPRFRLVARWSGRLTLVLSLAMAFLGVVLSRGGAF